MNEAFRTMLVPDAHVALARTITDTLAPVGGKDMYTTSLSPGGTAPATHWISSGFIDADYAQLMPLLEWMQDEEGAWRKTVISEGFPDVIAIMCSQTGLEIPMSDVEALLSAVDVTMETPQQAWARLGVQLVQTEEEITA